MTNGNFFFPVAGEQINDKTDLFCWGRYFHRDLEMLEAYAGASRYFLSRLDQFHRLHRHFRMLEMEVVAGAVVDAVDVEDVAVVFGSFAVAADVVAAAVAAGTEAGWRKGKHCTPTA